MWSALERSTLRGLIALHLTNTYTSAIMTALANRTWTILGEQFEFDELKDMASNTAQTQVFMASRTHLTF